ncbi:hypothetical protein XENOCAPTIV_030229, partial [Xenoophorus captivus]
AMKVLQTKGIIHRDLKPQNILLSYPPGRKSHSNNTCIKIGRFDMGLQTYVCFENLETHGLPRSIMLISIETSSHLKNLLLGLLQRNHKDRMDFGHPMAGSSTHIPQAVTGRNQNFPDFSSRPTSQQPPQAGGLGTRLHSAPCLLECATGGGRQKIKKQHSDPVAVPPIGLMTVRPLHSSPRLSELMQRNPLPTILGSPSRAIPPFEFPKPPSSPNLVTFLTQKGLVVDSPGSRTAPGELRDLGQQAPALSTNPTYCVNRLNDDGRSFGRSQSASRMSDMLLMVAFGAGGHPGDRGSSENLASEKAIDITGSPAGSLTSRYPQTGIYPEGFEAPPSPRYSFTDPITANMGGAVTFEAPELPEETLMEAAALDEMFHQVEASILRYHKALLLMEGLSLLLTEQDDLLSVSKCENLFQLLSTCSFCCFNNVSHLLRV